MDYLTDGGPGGGSGLNEAVYSFYTDESKSVRCDMSSSDVPPDRAACEIVKGKETSVTYPVPAMHAGACDPADFQHYLGDGYQVILGIAQRLGKDASFWGCREVESDTPQVMAQSKLLPDGATLVAGTLKCSVASGVVTCSYVDPAKTASFTFGLSVATFTQ
jgi:hypothetical protein